jgi:hypothetical protein
MEKSIQDYIDSLKLGEIQQFKNLAMVPVVSDYDDGLDYITLGQNYEKADPETKAKHSSRETC